MPAGTRPISTALRDPLVTIRAAALTVAPGELRGTMRGSVFKRCASCPEQRRYRKGDRKCPGCGAREVSWGYIIDVGTKPNGRRKRRVRTGFATKQDADAALEGFLTDHDEVRPVVDDRITVHAFLMDTWLPTIKMSIEATTWEGYRGIITSYVLPRIGDVRLAELTAPTLNWLYADARENGRIRSDEPLALKTVREIHVTLHRALEDAVRWGYLRDNPAHRANPPSATAARNARKQAIRTWTAEQVEAFASQIAEHPFFPLWLLAASTGMRRSELLGLCWRDVDLDRALLAVRQVLVVVDGRPYFKDAPKSQHGYRTIRVPGLAVEELRVLRERQTAQRGSTGRGDQHDLVFCRPDGDPWHPDYITETIRELILGSGLPRIRPLQDLRHTHATLLLADGENAKVVQERLGHHSHSFTADTYQHVMPGMDEAAAARFATLVFRGVDRFAYHEARGE
jgi:integrase